MGLRKNNTRTYHRKLFAGQLERIVLLKRNDDQQEGVVRAIILYQCRKSMVQKVGEQIQGDMVVGHTTVWHIPVIELKRTGVNWLNSLDRIVDKQGRYWQPEATTRIDIKLFENHVDLSCLRVDPTPAEQLTGFQ